MQHVNSNELYSWINEISKSNLDEIIWPPILKPFHLVTLSLMLRKNHQSDKLASLPEKLKKYAVRMGLYESV